MIYFHLPDFNRNMKLNTAYFDYFQAHRDFFIDDMEIAYIFDSFPVIWNGGRNVFGSADTEYIHKTISEINRRGIKVAFTFSNCLLEEEHLNDFESNQVMEIASDIGSKYHLKNSVIVNSPILEDYIRKEFPGFGVILSTTRQIPSVDEINTALERDYELVVLDYNMNHDWEALNLISDKKRCEFLVNACCEPNCPVRREHYRFISELQIKYADPDIREQVERERWECKFGNHDYFTFRNFKNFIGIDEIREKYEPLGFSHFKLEGRGSTTIHLLEQYVQYMAKPEWRDKVRYEMLLLLFRKEKGHRSITTN